MSADPQDKSYAELALALGPLLGDLNPEDLLMPFRLMFDLRKLNLSCIDSSVVCW